MITVMIFIAIVPMGSDDGHVRVLNEHHTNEQSGAGGAFTVQTGSELVHGETKSGTKSSCYLQEDQSE